MDFVQSGSVTSIVVIAYLVGTIAKSIPTISDRFIPVIVGIAGAILGAFGMRIIPGFPADNILDAISVGIVSGLASTGINQIYKQLKQEESNEDH